MEKERKKVGVELEDFAREHNVTTGFLYKQMRLYGLQPSFIYQKSADGNSLEIHILKWAADYLAKKINHIRKENFIEYTELTSEKNYWGE